MTEPNQPNQQIVDAFFKAYGGRDLAALRKVMSEDAVCVRTVTHREDGKNIDHYATVLWTFKDGKIVEGRHFFADPPAVDAYFTAGAGQ